MDCLANFELLKPDFHCLKPYMERQSIGECFFVILGSDGAPWALAEGLGLLGCG